MELKKKAWIATSVLMALIFIWSIFAVHNAAVAAARASITKTGTCPFTGKAAQNKSEPSGGHCCGGDDNKGSIREEIEGEGDKSKALKATEKFKDVNVEEFTEEQINQCPHLKAKSLQAKKSKSNKKK